MKQFFTYVPGSHFNIVEMLFLGEPFKIEHVDTHGVTILFFSRVFGVITVHSNLVPALPLVRPKYVDSLLMLQAGNF